VPVPGDAAPVPRPVPAGRLAVARGHGTRNDFVLLDDRAGDVDLTADLVRALCDRRGGVGGDGVIRLLATAPPDAPAPAPGDPTPAWFMDYRNADGTTAQMCGNGVRVLAAFVERLGLWDGRGELVVGTRAGVRRVWREPSPDGVAWYGVDMGAWTLPGGEAAAAAGGDAQVHVAGLAVDRPGLGVDVGNPHTVVVLASHDELDAADLTRSPEVTPVPPDGTNVELVVPLGEREGADGALEGAVRMRVHERGVGETASCGTGACAAALAVRAWGAAGAPDRWSVRVPGGTLRVQARDDGHVTLAGPAVVVADVVVDLPALTA
jgi:diaminopimelate epimerase